MKGTPDDALILGGDSRLAMIPGDSRFPAANRYGCTPRPHDTLCTFSSCTANIISSGAYKAVEEEFALITSAGVNQLEHRIDQQRAQLMNFLGLAGTHTRIVFAPSGTDATLLALFIARGGSPAPLDSIVIAPEETGRGVPLAAAGLHSDERTAQGATVTVGTPVPGLADGVALVRIPVRDDNGVAFATSDIDRRVRMAVTTALSAGRAVLLHAMDSSKFGLRYPSPEVLEQLQSLHGGTLRIVVDACQGRISDTRLAWHLNHGHLVSITGSKFYSGPPFSGALLVPETLAASTCAMTTVPAGLSDYTSASAWPMEWQGIRAALAGPANLGLHLRWTAAVAEMRRYAAIPSADRAYRLHHFAECVTQMLHEQAQLRSMPLAFPTQDEGGDAGVIQTIFPFFLLRDQERMSFDECVRVYQELNTLGMHIGQPVRVGKAGALRICADARLVGEPWPGTGTPTISPSIEKLRQVLNMAVQLSSGAKPPKR